MRCLPPRRVDSAVSQDLERNDDFQSSAVLRWPATICLDESPLSGSNAVIWSGPDAAVPLRLQKFVLDHVPPLRDQFASRSIDFAGVMMCALETASCLNWLPAPSAVVFRREVSQVSWPCEQPNRRRAAIAARGQNHEDPRVDRRVELIKARNGPIYE